MHEKPKAEEGVAFTMRVERYYCAVRLICFVLAFCLVIISLSCRSSSDSGNNAPNVTLTSRAENTEVKKEETGAKKIEDTGSAPAALDTPTVSRKEVLPISWSFSPAQYRGKNGQQYTFKCPPKGQAGTVFGTDVYTDDSSVCTAAVHEGLITLDSGGIVEIEIRPGQDAFVGSERNNIKSADFNVHWGGSFVFVGQTGGS